MPIFTPGQETSEAMVNKSKRLLDMVYQSFVGSYKREFDAFWRNPLYTPGEMAIAWDTECVKLFTNSEATRQYINAVDPDALPAEYQTPLSTYTVERENGVPTGRISIP